MLMNMKELLKVADEKGFAVPAFNIGSDQLLKAVMQKVKEMKSPVILELSPDEFNFVETSLVKSMIYEASRTDVPVVIHLDHGDKYETVVRAIQAGFTSVMIDASKLPYEENIEITKKVCEVAHLANVSVESELGTIGTTGNSIEGGTVGVIYTDPDQAKKPEVGRALWGWQYTSAGRVTGINGNADLDICYQDPAGTEEIRTEPGTIWCLSIADVWSETIARAAATAYPGCQVHKAAVLDVGGIEIWIASIADVWTQAQAEEVQRQFAALGVAGVVHNIRVLE